MGLDDAVALGVERDRADRRPVARGARPARRVALAGLEVQRVARSQDGLILAAVALRWVT